MHKLDAVECDVVVEPASSTDPVIHYHGKCYRNMQNVSVKSGNPKNLVLCLDGTENQFGTQPFSNVLKLFGMLEKDDDQQICYYQPGIGVNFKSESNEISEANFFTSKINKAIGKVDALFAFTFEQHVIAAYAFLCRFYRKGDQIYLFGFR